MTYTFSKQLVQLLARHFDVTQNACQESRSKRFAGMHWDDRRPTVGVSNEVVAAFDTNHSESLAAQGRNEILALNCGERCHALTVTRCTPMKSSGSPELP